jgi:hypothetical protein
MRVINLISLKGGQGVTTTANLLATTYALTNRVLLVGDEDIASLTNIEPLKPGEVKQVRETYGNTNISVAYGPISAEQTQGYDVVITDNVSIDGLAGETYLVIQPCYLALRKAVAMDDSLSETINGVIVVRPQGRVLTDRDISSVLGKPIVTVINHDENVARASDAGLLLQRNIGGHYIKDLTPSK